MAVKWFIFLLILMRTC